MDGFQTLQIESISARARSLRKMKNRTPRKGNSNRFRSSKGTAPFLYLVALGGTIGSTYAFGGDSSRAISDNPASKYHRSSGMEKRVKRDGGVGHDDDGIVSPTVISNNPSEPKVETRMPNRETTVSTTIPSSEPPSNDENTSSQSGQRLEIIIPTVVVAAIIGALLFSYLIMRSRRRGQKHGSSSTGYKRMRWAHAINKPDGDRKGEMSQTVLPLGNGSQASEGLGDPGWDPESTFAQPFTTSKKRFRFSQQSQASSIFQKLRPTPVPRVPKIRIKGQQQSPNMTNEFDKLSVNGKSRRKSKCKSKTKGKTNKNKPLPIQPTVEIQPPPRTLKSTSTRTSTIFHLDRPSSPSQRTSQAFNLPPSTPTKQPPASIDINNNIIMSSKFSCSTPTTFMSFAESTSDLGPIRNGHRSCGTINDGGTIYTWTDDDSEKPRFRSTHSWVLHQQSRTAAGRNNRLSLQPPKSISAGTGNGAGTGMESMDEDSQRENNFLSLESEPGNNKQQPQMQSFLLPLNLPKTGTSWIAVSGEQENGSHY